MWTVLYIPVCTYVMWTILYMNANIFIDHFPSETRGETTSDDQTELCSRYGQSMQFHCQLTAPIICTVGLAQMNMGEYKLAAQYFLQAKIEYCDNPDVRFGHTASPTVHFVMQFVALFVQC